MTKHPRYHVKQFARHPLKIYCTWIIVIRREINQYSCQMLVAGRCIPLAGAGDLHLHA